MSLLSQSTVLYLGVGRRHAVSVTPDGKYTKQTGTSFDAIASARMFAHEWLAVERGVR